MNKWTGYSHTLKCKLVFISLRQFAVEKWLCVCVCKEVHCNIIKTHCVWFIKYVTRYYPSQAFPSTLEHPQFQLSLLHIINPKTFSYISHQDIHLCHRSSPSCCLLLETPPPSPFTVKCPLTAGLRGKWLRTGPASLYNCCPSYILWNKITLHTVPYRVGKNIHTEENVQLCSGGHFPEPRTKHPEVKWS
jgi:hypothetical protein